MTQSQGDGYRIKTDSALTRMGIAQEMLHESDRKEFPERHYLMKDFYLSVEMHDICIACAHPYEWNKFLEYDARTDSYYKKSLGANNGK